MSTGTAPFVSRRRALAQLAAMVGAGIGLPAAIGRWLPRPRGADDVETELDFNPAEERRNLVKEPLGWVLIGNSMLNSRLYTPHLNKVSGWHSRKLAVGGTQSAIWWLFFKNILIASGARPHWVTVFFRESDLTWPDFRISGKNAELIRRLQTDQEPEWEQVMAGRSPLVSHSSSVVETVFGLEDHDDWARRRVQDGAFELTALEGVKRGPRRMELNELFSLDRLRGDLGDDGGDGPPPPALGADPKSPGVKLPDPGMYAQAPTVFDASSSASFLPHFVALAARHDIRLHFHRVKRRPDDAGRRPELPIFRRYLDDLQDYLRSQGCAYSDESAIPDQTLAWYQDGDHLHKARREAFAAKFWTLVRDQIGPPPPRGGRRPQAAG